ncbi:MAG: ABC transporter permease [Nitrospirota bacterium]
MKFSLLTIALRNIKRKPFRTAVLVTAIALLVSILVFGTSFLYSVKSAMERASNRLGADVLVVPTGARSFADEVLLETKIKVFYMDRSILDRVREVEGVSRVTYQTYLTTILGLCCDIPPTTVVVFNQETDFVVNAWLNESFGRKLEKGEVIIGNEAFENLGLLDVGRSLLFGVEFNIAGVLQKTGTGFDNAIFMNDENIDDVISRGKAGVKRGDISLVFVKVKPGYDPYTVSRNIEGAILEVDTVERSSMGKRIISTFKDVSSVFLITIILASVLSAFLAWTVFSAIVNERSREVAIMKAIGAKGSHIMMMFILEVMIIGAVGSLLGIEIGTFLSLKLSKIFGLLKDISISLSPVEQFRIGLLGFLAGTGICIIGALSPIIRMKRLDPYAAIKEA